MKNLVTASGALALAVLAGTASADIIIPLGGGWEAIVANPAVANIVPLNAGSALDDGFVRVNKIATMNQIDPFTGAPQPITITFRQNAVDAQTVNRIIINAETITNLTGMTWTGYRQVLALSPYVTFNAASTGMSVAPFTTNTILAGSREFASSGGSVANGGVWTPGATGDLIIDVNLAGSSSPVIFTLKEIPVIPTPGATVLAVAGLGLIARRRR